MRIREGEVDLDVALYVSFSLPMYERSEDCWVKVYGYGAGTYICGGGGIECYGPACSSDFLRFSAGLWIDKEEGLMELDGKALLVAEDVVDRFYCVSVSASPWDGLEILTAAFLSKRTDYHRNTVRWVRAILSRVASLGREDLDSLKAIASQVYQEFRSYQLQQYIEVLDKLYSTVSLVSRLGLTSLKQQLMRIRYVGPKVVSSFILHSGLDQSTAPVDVHYVRFLKRYNLLNDPLSPPNKDFCSMYNCHACPMRMKCLYAYTSHLFKKLNGFIQTAAYVSGKLSVGSCRDLNRDRNKLLKYYP